MISTECCGPGPPLIFLSYQFSKIKTSIKNLLTSSLLSSTSKSSLAISTTILEILSSKSSLSSTILSIFYLSWLKCWVKQIANEKLINYFDNNYIKNNNTNNKNNVQLKKGKMKIKKRIKHQKLIKNESKIMTTTNKQNKTIRTATTNWIFLIISFLLFILLSLHGVDAEKSKHYYMQSLCKNHFLQQLYRKIDGAVLWSQNERNLDCIITFQTHSILQRFMLRFDMLQLDCNDHLYVYDGAHAVGTYKTDLSCRNTKQSVGSIFTRTNFVTLKYVTDGWGTDTNGFKLVITAVKDPKNACKNFRCTLREFCIHPDLVCDGVNHCGDGSDESTAALCPSQNPKTLLGLELSWFVLMAVCSVLTVSACIVGWSICICRRSSNNQNTSIQLRQTSAETNGSSKHLHGTLPRDQTTLPMSGNWHHPAGPSGYHRIQHKLKMATKVRPIWCLANLDN